MHFGIDRVKWGGYLSGDTRLLGQAGEEFLVDDGTFCTCVDDGFCLDKGDLITGISLLLDDIDGRHDFYIEHDAIFYHP